MNTHQYASQAQELFVLPDAVVRIKQVIDSDEASIEDVAEVVNYDPSLMTQVLKIANSALYKFPNKIDTVSKAIQVIGTKATYDLTVAYGVSRAFSDVDSQAVDLDKFWEQSVCCALLSKYFADRLSFPESERLFVTGLLHNIGELVVTQLAPELATRCAAFNEQSTPLQLQLENLNTSYAEIGAELIRHWGIPESIAGPVARQHHMQADATQVDEQIMQLSYVLALDNVNHAFYPGHANLEAALYERLGLDENDLENALAFVNLQSLSVLALFNPSAVAIH